MLTDGVVQLDEFGSRRRVTDEERSILPAMGTCTTGKLSCPRGG